MIWLVVETEDGELLSAVGAHVLLARRLRRVFSRLLGRPCRVREVLSGEVWRR